MYNPGVQVEDVTSNVAIVDGDKVTYDDSAVFETTKDTNSTVSQLTTDFIDLSGTTLPVYSDLTSSGYTGKLINGEIQIDRTEYLRFVLSKYNSGHPIVDFNPRTKFLLGVDGITSFDINGKFIVKSDFVESEQARGSIRSLVESFTSTIHKT